MFDTLRHSCGHCLASCLPASQGVLMSAAIFPVTRCKLGGCDSLLVLQISCMGDPDGFAKGGFVLLDQDFKVSPALFQAPHQCCSIAILTAYCTSELLSSLFKQQRACSPAPLSQQTAWPFSELASRLDIWPAVQSRSKGAGLMRPLSMGMTSGTSPSTTS